MEEFRSVTNEYQVSNLGRVKSLERIVKYGKFTRLIKERILNPSNSNGYMRVSLSKEGNRTDCNIHVLVATAFIDNPHNKPEVNHIDGNRSNNNVNNLEWCTHQENCQHAYDTGLRKPLKGVKNGMSCLTENDVREIKKRLINEKVNEISKDYPVGIQAIYKIKSGLRWSHIKQL